MSYQSPIEVFQTQMQSQIEGEIYKAVMKIGVNVDKDELLKALRYDRDQYQKGYTDRDSKIVRCKDCKYWYRKEYGSRGTCESKNMNVCGIMDADWFCADGERRNNDD